MKYFLRTYYIVFSLLLFFTFSGCSTLQTKAGDSHSVGHVYSGTKKAMEDFGEGPDHDHNYGPSGAIGVGALFIPVTDFIGGTFYYIYTTVDMLGSVVGDTLFLPVDLIYQDGYDIDKMIKNNDIEMLVTSYQAQKVTEPPLINAITTADSAKIQNLLKISPQSVNLAGPLGYSPLFYAAAINDTKSIDKLIASGAVLKPSNAAVILVYLSDEKTLSYLLDNVDVNLSQVAPAKHFHSSNLLTAALRNKHHSLAQSFIEMDGIDIEHKDKNNVTPLLYSIRSLDLNTTLKLLKHGVTISPENELMSAALKVDDLSFFELLLKHGAKLPPNAILLSVGRKDVNLTKRLIEMGADVQVRDERYHNSALHRAALNNDVKMIRLLVDSGIDVNSENKDGATPIYVAVEKYRAKAVHTLLELGADASIAMMRSYYGPKKPLGIALNPIPSYMQSAELSQQRQIIIEMLVPKVATYDDLVHAVRIGDLKSVSLLIDNGIDPNRGYAIYHAEDEAVRDLLVKNGADANDEKRFSKCVSRWKVMFADTRYESDADKSCENHCRRHTERCP